MTEQELREWNNWSYKAEPAEHEGKYLSDKSNLIFGYNMKFTIISGARGYGKTYLLKRQMAKLIKNNIKFGFIRLTQTEIDILTQNGGQAFTAELDELLNDGKITLFKGGNIMRYSEEKNEEPEYVGVYCATTVYQQGKGANKDTIRVKKQNEQEQRFDEEQQNFNAKSQKIEYVFFDEFLPDGKNKNDKFTTQVLNTCVNLVRNRSAKFFLTSNSLNKYNELYNDWGLSDFIDKFGFYTNKKRGILFYYAASSDEYKKEQEQGTIYSVFFGTQSFANVFGNEFTSDDTTENIANLEAGATLFCRLIANGKPYLFYRHPYEAKLWVIRDLKQTANIITYTVDPEKVGGIILDYSLIKARIKKVYSKGQLYYNSIQTKIALVDYIK